MAPFIIFNAKYMYIVQLRNKESDPEKYALKLRVHQEGVRHCQYSTDGTKVLSCASLEVKVSILTLQALPFIVRRIYYT